MADESDAIRSRPQKFSLPPTFMTCVAIYIATCLVLLGLIAASPHHPVYDEAWYLATVELLKRDGISLAFIRDYPGPAGPLFTIVFAAVQSALALQLPWLRLVNFALLAASTLVMQRLLLLSELHLPALTRRQSAWLAGGLLSALPTVAVSTGMTLTEMPALFFVVVFLFAAMSAERANRFSYAWALVAGVALGLAVLGRQNYLVVLPCLALLADWPPRSLGARNPLIIAAAAVSLAAPVFLIWGGLLPPRMASLGYSILPFHAVLGAGYLGIVALLIAPEMIARLKLHPDLWIAVALAILSLALFGTPFVPMNAAMQFASPAVISAAGWTFSAAISIVAFVFLAAVGRYVWDHVNDRRIRFYGAAVLLGVASNTKIYQFSSRYIFVFLPFLLLLLAREIRLSWHLPWRLAAGATISLTSLASYFR